MQCDFRLNSRQISFVLLRVKRGGSKRIFITILIQRVSLFVNFNMQSVCAEVIEHHDTNIVNFGLLTMFVVQ